MNAQRLVTHALARLFRAMQDRRATQARRARALTDALGLARAQDVRELDSRIDLALGRLAALREARR